MAGWSDHASLYMEITVMNYKKGDYVVYIRPYGQSIVGCIQRISNGAAYILNDLDERVYAASLSDLSGEISDVEIIQKRIC